MNTTTSDPFAGGLDATGELWRRLARPFDLPRTVDALLGLSPEVVEQLAGVLLATGDEAERLLEGMPKTMRSLKSAVGASTERCLGELRGPVQWSATIAAQGSSLGNRDVYVCAAPRRDHDVDENRVLVAALRAVADAGHRVERVAEDSYDDEASRRARHNARVAIRYLDHQSLEGVRTDTQLTRRALRRTRSGKASAPYRAALAMLERAAEPLSLDELAPFCDRRTRVQHGVLAAIIDELEARGMRVPALRAEGGSLFAGPVEYIHPRRRGDRSRLHGIVIGRMLIDVPDRLRATDRGAATAALNDRAAGREVYAVLSAADISVAVDRAIVSARQGAPTHT